MFSISPFLRMASGNDNNHTCYFIEGTNDAKTVFRYGDLLTDIVILSRNVAIPPVIWMRNVTFDKNWIAYKVLCKGSGFYHIRIPLEFGQISFKEPLIYEKIYCNYIFLPTPQRFNLSKGLPREVLDKKPPSVIHFTKFRSMFGKFNITHIDFNGIEKFLPFKLCMQGGNSIFEITDFDMYIALTIISPNRVYYLGTSFHPDRFNEASDKSGERRENIIDKKIIARL